MKFTFRFASSRRVLTLHHHVYNELNHHLDKRPRPAAGGDPMRVLVVEDDPDIAELVHIRLAADGHELTVVHDGQSGQDALNSDPFDLVLLDWTLPVMSGIALCAWIRSEQRFVDLPIILMTARAQQSDIDEGLAAGVNDFVVKPFSPRELARRVNSFATESED